MNVKLLNNQKFTDYELKKIGTSGPYLNQREVTKRFEFPPGTYVLIPSMYRKNKRMKFIQRIYVEGGMDNEASKEPSSTDVKRQATKKPKESALKKSLLRAEKKGDDSALSEENNEQSGVCTLI